MGFPAGGGYDLHARLVARHLGRFLPGTPLVTVENMAGAGGAAAANYLSTVAEPDGLSLGLVGEVNAPELLASGLLDRVTLLGSPGPTSPVVFFSRASGIGSLESWQRTATAPRLGSSGVRATTGVVPRILASALGLPMRLVSGYGGTSEVRLALEGGELDGYAFDDAVTRGDLAVEGTVVLRVGPAVQPARASVPDALDYVAEGLPRRLVQTGILAMRPFGRVFIAPKRVPAERTALLRDALTRTWNDPAFLADAHAAGLTIAPMSGQQLDAAAVALATDPEILATLRTLLQQD